MDRLSGEQRGRPIGARRGGGQRRQQELLRGASGARQWRGDGKGVGSYALRHIRRPTPHIGPCWLGCPKEVLARGKWPFHAEKCHAVGPAYSRQWQPRVGDGSGNRRTENEGWQGLPSSIISCRMFTRRSTVSGSSSLTMY